jgi:hypothetical protein
VYKQNSSDPLLRLPSGDHILRPLRDAAVTNVNGQV